MGPENHQSLGRAVRVQESRQFAGGTGAALDLRLL